MAHSQHQFVELALVDQCDALFEGRGVALLPRPFTAHGTDRPVPGDGGGVVAGQSRGQQAFAHGPEGFHQLAHISAVLCQAMDAYPALTAMAA
ncbi:hypothetical protein RS9916_36192 [Synechococcus sp. RS9916]|nr:hypothetical protein RS9916_36192 [Synechococcus sp. RS9916]